VFLLHYVLCNEILQYSNEMQQELKCKVNGGLIWLAFMQCDVAVTVIILRHTAVDSELHN
jgi:hypothetical protein